MRPHGSLGGLAPVEFPNRPRRGIWTPKLTYQRPETGEQARHYDMRPLIDYWPTMDRESWDVPEFRTLLARGIAWASKRPSADGSTANARWLI